MNMFSFTLQFWRFSYESNKTLYIMERKQATVLTRSLSFPLSPSILSLIKDMHTRPRSAWIHWRWRVWGRRAWERAALIREMLYRMTCRSCPGGSFPTASIMLVAERRVHAPSSHFKILRWHEQTFEQHVLWLLRLHVALLRGSDRRQKAGNKPDEPQTFFPMQTSHDCP